MGNSYNQAFNSFSEDERRRIEHKLEIWENSSVKGSRIAPNIRSENFLEIEAMRGILTTFLKVDSSDIIELEEHYMLECYRNSLKGEEIEFENQSPSFLGRAVPKDGFINMLVNKYDLTPEKVEDLLDALEDNSLNTVQQKMDMTNFGAWVTWSVDQNTDDPFYYIQPPDEALKICANLGLSHQQEDQEHIVFTYTYRDDFDLRYPTIADAALYDYFKPATPNAGHGWTRPRNAAELSLNGMETEVRPRPEAVHPKQKLEVLDQPIRRF